MVHHSSDATAIGAQRTPRTAPPVADLPPELGGAVRPADHRRLYLRVLASGRWARIRRDAIARAGGRCERCGRQFGRRWRAKATVHHLHYETLGRETLADVEALCQLCHAEEHGTTPRWAR